MPRHSCIFSKRFAFHSVNDLCRHSAILTPQLPVLLLQRSADILPVNSFEEPEIGSNKQLATATLIAQLQQTDLTFFKLSLH